jgi:hypothetical protein
MNRCKSVIEIGRRRFLTGAGVAAAVGSPWSQRDHRGALLNVPGNQYIDP